MRSLKVVGLLIAMSLVIFGCGGQGSSGNGGETIVIGSLHPLTGPLAVSGEQMDKAVKMAVKDVNASGGIKSMDGARLKVSASDTQGDPATAQTEAQRLIDKRAVVLTGAFQSASTINVARVAERSQIPLVIDVSVADEILEQGYRYSFRVQPDATGMGTYGARFLSEMSEQAGSPVEKVAYIHEDSEFGTSVFAAFSSEAKKIGMEVTDEITYNALQVTDLTSEVTQAAATNPDMIIVSGYYEDGLIVTDNLASVKPDVEGVYGVADAAFDAPQFPQDAGQKAEGFLSTNYHWDATSERANKIRQKFEEETGQQMRTEAMYSYQAVEVIADALERAGSSEPQAIRDALSKTSIETNLLPFPGPIEFEQTGQNVNAQPVAMQVQRGEVVQIYPKEFAQEAPQIPATPWDGGS